MKKTDLFRNLSIGIVTLALVFMLAVSPALAFNPGPVTGFLQTEPPPAEEVMPEPGVGVPETGEQMPIEREWVTWGSILLFGAIVLIAIAGNAARRTSPRVDE